MMMLFLFLLLFRPLANDHPEEPASRKWSSGGTGLLQKIIRHPCYASHLCPDSDSISRTFLEQFVLVFIILLCEIVCQLFPCNTRAFSHTHEVSLTRQPCGSIEEVDRYNVLKMFLPFARIQIVGIFHKSTFSDVSRRSVRMVGWQGPSMRTCSPSSLEAR